MSKALVLGASGNTGKLLVEQLLSANIEVISLARNDQWINDKVASNPLFRFHQAQVAELTVEDFLPLLAGVDVVYSCLGHNVSAKGIWGKPRKLVANTVKTCCEAIETLKPKQPIKFVLMASTGCVNKDLAEKPPLSQRAAVSVIRALVPPHRDNELAVKHLRLNIGQKHQFVDWVIARPDGLIDEINVTNYTLNPSPTRNAIFDAGKTSRINVAHFMSQVAQQPELWKRWSGKMPVLYNEL